MAGALYAWVGRHAMNADGISYLDMADAYLRRDWPNAISTVWSPLYAWLLAAGRMAFGAGPASEFPAVQAVNFVMYLVSVAAFGFLMRSLLCYRRTVQSAAHVPASVSDRALLAAGYAVFVWSALDLIGVNLVTPHLTVAALIYLAVGLLLRIAVGRAGAGVYLGLGVVLGLAYLARTPMAVLAVVILGLAAAAGWRQAAGWRRLSGPAGALAAFVVVAGVYAVPLFLMKGRMPLGDFPRINYAFWVNGYPRQHWQGDPPGSGTPRHTTRRLWVKPAVYEFGEPVGGTYPPWYDPSYWYAGIQPRFDPVGHVRVLQRSARIESLQDALDHWLPSVILAVVAGLYAGARGWLTWRDLGAQRYLLIPAVIGFGLFAPVQLIPRYVGGFVPLLWLGVMAALNPSNSRWARSVGTGLAVAVLVFHAGLAAPGIAKRGLAVAAEAVRGTPASTDVHWQVASGLHEMGIGPGARVAVLGSGFNAYWARLLRARIVAEIPVDAVADYWAASGQTRARIGRLLADAGAEILVASPRVLPSSVGPGELAAMGWRRVGATDFHVLLLSR
ncbi:MAG: hypothetical protein QN131_03680 [Armatimonadota bacterium]|nr:hypothetical protein [Armatimonadota bacterium]MDR7549023.1 hypothetical protein [Armatimonadota bacterium]